MKYSDTSLQIKIINSKKDHNIFYLKIAPILLNGAITKELGVCPQTQDTYTWFVAFKDDDVVGFLVFRVESKKAYYFHEYILPEFRGNGIYAKLFEARFKYIKENHTDLKKAYGVFTKDGYQSIQNKPHTIIKEYKNYKKVEFDL